MESRNTLEKILLMQSRASRLLGISNDEFWNLTPYEYNLILKDYNEEYKAKERLKNIRVAKIQVAIYNSRIGLKRDQFMKIEDFVERTEEDKQQELRNKIELLKARKWGQNGN